MSWTLIGGIIFTITVCVGVPIVMIWSAVDHFRHRGSERRGSGGISAGIGAALQELDRLTTRPANEFKIETETRVVKREDDSGDN